MIKTISKTKEINESLLSEGKVTVLNRPEDIEAIDALNAAMEEVHREYIVKNRNSQISAAQTIFNA
ncbi:MAG: hypothetical protein V4616_05965 [Bacteroidota bacterium]